MLASFFSINNFSNLKSFLTSFLYILTLKYETPIYSYHFNNLLQNKPDSLSIYDDSEDYISNIDYCDSYYESLYKSNLFYKCFNNIYENIKNEGDDLQHNLNKN